MDRVLESRFDQLLRRHAELGAPCPAPGSSGAEFAKLSKEYSELGADRGRHREPAPRRGGTRRRGRDGRQRPTIPS